MPVEVDTFPVRLAGNRAAHRNFLAGRSLYSVAAVDRVRYRNWDRPDQYTEMRRYLARNYWRFHKDPGRYLGCRNTVLDRSYYTLLPRIADMSKNINISTT